MKETQRLLEGMNLKEPFAGYSDFDDCVRHNKGKGDPEGYCAVILKKTRPGCGESARTELVKAFKTRNEEKAKVNLIAALKEELKCPKCDSTNIFDGRPDGFRKCRHCGYEW